MRDDPGYGDKRIIKWHFYPLAKRCMPFTFHGSGGNENNFDSLSECVKSCGNYSKNKLNKIFPILSAASSAALYKTKIFNNCFLLKLNQATKRVV